MQDLTPQEASTLLNRWRIKPETFLHEVLGIEKIWSLQAQLLDSLPRAMKEHKAIYMGSGHALGKDYMCAAIALWFLYTHSPSKVLLTAPCNDDQTEILTDSGWKLFKDLTQNDKVAQRVGDIGIEFVKPSDIISFPYNGELIGFESQLVDFLVTPNHRCLFNNEIKEARDIFGKIGKFTKVAEHVGDAVDNDFAEFMGFWFAEGYAEYNESSRKYRIVVTQKNKIAYVENLLDRVKDHFKNKLKVDKRQYGGNNYTFYDKTQAKVFASFGKTMTKRVPQWLKDADKQGLRAFLKGFLEGDGCVDLNGSVKLTTACSGLADDLHEMCVKAGYISNKRTYTYDEYVILHDGDKVYRGEKTGEKKTCYDIKMWQKRGEYPSSQRQTHSSQPYWYKKQYNGMVYSVTVPSGVVMIRRNGKNSWTGNTDRQVKKIMWGDTLAHFNRMKAKLDLGGTATADPYIEIQKENWFLIGFTTKDSGASAQAKGGKFQGFHSPNVCVIASEAQAIEDTIYDQIDGVTTGGNNLVIYIGNPTRASGSFARGLRAKDRNIVFNFSCLDNPNYKHRKEVIPGLASYTWVEDKREKWGVDDPRWYGRVLGRIPATSINNIFSDREINAMKAKNDIGAGSYNCGVAVDVAGEGDDDNVIMSGQGGKPKYMFTQGNVQPSVLAMQALKMCRIVNGVFIIIDCDGLGIGAYQELTAMPPEVTAGIHIIKYHGCSSLKEVKKIIGKPQFQNMRAQTWFDAQDMARNGEAALYGTDFYLIEELMEVKYFINKRGVIQIEDKADIKERLGRSPDRADAWTMLMKGFKMNLSKRHAPTDFPVDKQGQGIPMDQHEEAVMSPSGY